MASQNDWCFGARMNEPAGRFSTPVISALAPAIFSCSHTQVRAQNFGTNQARCLGDRK